MVCYCCVQVCSNSTNSVKKTLRPISFHAFPSNAEMRQKWLRAIGRPNWDPPNYVRICSDHFSCDKVNHEGRRTRITDDAYPVNNLPPNSNFEASNVEVCRICLATDIKMYSLQNGIFKVCLETLTVFNGNGNLEGLPQYVCFECGACILKCYKLVDKSMIAQATLLDIFADNGKITKQLVRNRDRKQLNLKSSLYIHHVSSYHIFEYIYDEEQELSNLKKICKKEKTKSEQMEIYNPDSVSVCKNMFKSEDNDHDENNSENEMSVDNESDSKISHNNYPLEEDIENSSVDHYELKFTTASTDINKVTKYEDKHRTKKTNKKINNGLTPNEIHMHKYFNIVKLSLQEQIIEWNKRNENVRWNRKTSYKCEACHKVYANIKSYKAHITCHDPTRGAAECPVCKHHFKNEVLVNSHINRAHAKMFHCKNCSKVFHNVSVAKKHHRRHAGYVYRCAQCAFSSAHASSLGAHARAHHASAHACTSCGHAFVSRRGLALHTATAHADVKCNEGENIYKCEECDISFNSEGAKRVHILTSKQHKKTFDTAAMTDPGLLTTCKRCGLSFPTSQDLLRHVRDDHARTAKKTSWSLPGDKYPTQCEHCEQIVGSRQEHWSHVRGSHPAMRARYRPVVTAVCHTCGKGFQNASKLRIHSLRHGRPRYHCGGCPRVFYDKYALARHAHTHRPQRPHACRVCERAFKAKGNLARHARVHSGIAPYECVMCNKKFKYSTSLKLHVRTVHQRLPPPPRARRRHLRPLLPERPSRPSSPEPTDPLPPLHPHTTLMEQ